ncbi:hypothetical protein WH91_16900, partial [Devosia psychrophila]
MSVNPSKAEHKATFGGKTYYFCSKGCLSKFMVNPESYVIAADPKPAEAPAGTIWTCPMHPEIRRDAPGSCPICGMALEPEMPSADSAPSPELVDMTRRFWIGSALAVPVFVLEM